MGRSSWLVIPVIAVLGAAAWWILGRDTSPKPLLLDEGSATTAEETATDAPDLKAGPRTATVGQSNAASAESPYRIEGVVLDEKGKGVADVTIRAHVSGKTRDPDDIASWGDPKADDPVRKEFAGIDEPKATDGSDDPNGKSDSSGRFAISVPDAGNYAVSAVPIPGRVGVNSWANPTKLKPVARTTVRLLAGNVLAGKVVDVDEKGVPAFVNGTWSPTAGTDNSWMSTVEVPSTATDPNGAFVLAAVPDGKGTLTVKVAGRGSFTGFSVTTPMKDPLILRIGASGVVKGRVADSTGQAVAGADISLSTAVPKSPPAGAPRGSVVRGKSQADGTFRIEGVVLGVIKRAAVAAVGYTSLSQSPPTAKWSGAEVKEGIEANLELVLVRGATVVGRVLDKTDKDAETPVLNAEVFLLGPTGAGTSYMQSVPHVMPVDRDGGFKFEDVPLGKYTLYARSPSHYLPVDGSGAPSFGGGRVIRASGVGGGAPATTTLVLTKESQVFEKNLLMLKGLPVEGIVKGPDGTPIEGAKVRSYADGFLQNSWQFGIQPQGPMTLATSGPDGRFKIPGLAPTDGAVLTASKPPLAGKPCKPFKVKADTPTTEVVLELEKGASVTGRVVDADGGPVSGASVQCWSQDGSGGSANETTGADGTFKLDGLTPGVYQIWAWSQAGGSAQKSLDPALTAGEARDGVELKMTLAKKGTKLSGTLVDDEGNPIASSQVSASGANGSSAWAQTDLDGAFTFSGLAEGKATISVQVMSSEGQFWSHEPATKETYDVPGEGIKVVVPKKTSITIAGRVLMPDGTPVPLCMLATKAGAAAGSKDDGGNRMVYATSFGGGGGGGAEVVSGEFRREVQLKAPFDVLITQARDVEGRPLNLRLSTTKITESNTSLEIRLEGGLEIRGKVLATDGAAVVGAWVTAGTANDRTVEDGAFKLVGLEGDEVSISVQPTEKYTAPAKPTKAKPGATDVVIRLEAGLSITGHIMDPLGSPVTQAYVQAMSSAGPGRNQFGAQPDAQGAFKIENLPRDGTYDITIQVWSHGGSKGASFKPWSKSGVKPGGEDLVIRLEGGESIEGVVVDAEGKPVAQAWVSAQAVLGGKGGGQNGSTDERGHFSVGGLDASATYVLRAQQWNNGPNRQSLPARAETGARDVKLVFPATAKLTGRLSGEGEKQSFSVVVRQSGPIVGDADTQLATGRTAADGSFSFDVPADVPLDVYVSKGNDDRYGFVAGVRAGGADVTVRLEAGKSIEGNADDAEGNPLAQGAWIVASNDAWLAGGGVDNTGKWRVRGLPPGRYRLRVRNDSGVTKAPFHVEADAGATGIRIRPPN